MDSNITRRGVLTSGVVVATAGCLAGGSLTDEQSTTTSETTTVQCERFRESPTDTALSEYRSLVGEFERISDIVGTPDQFRTDSAFGNTAFFYLNCSSEQSGCESDFLTAIEKFREAKTLAEETMVGFEELGAYVESCDVDNSELIGEQASVGVEKAQAFVPAIESFIDSAKRHVDEDKTAFEIGEDFSDGMSDYQDALGMDVMGADVLEQKVEVYDG